MKSVRFVRRAAIAVLCVATLASAARAADVLKQVPDSALAVIVINNLSAAGDRVDELAKKLGQNPPGGIEAALAVAGISEGVDRKGSAAIVVVAKEDGDEPGAIVLLPVTDYKKFVAQLSHDDADADVVKVEISGKEMALAQAGDYVAIVEAGDASLLDNVTEVSGNMSDKTAGVAAWLKQQDAYALATSAGIALAADKVIEAIDGAKEQFENLGDENQAEAIAMAMGMYKTLFTAMRRDVAQMVFGVRGSDGGLHLASRTIFKPDAAIGKLTALLPTPKGSLLAGLPDGKYILAGGTTMSPELTAAFYKWSGDMLFAFPGGKDIDPNEVQKMMKLAGESVKGVRSVAFGMLTGKPDAPIYSQIVAVMKVDDTKKFMAKYREVLAAMNDLAEANEDSPILQKSTTKDIEIDGHPGMEVTMKMSEKLLGDDPIAGEIVKRLLGDVEKLTVYLAAADDKNIAMGYIDQANVQRAIKSLAAGSASANADFRKTAAMLPAGSQVVGFLNLRELFQTVVSNLPPPFAAMAGPIANFQDSPSIGFGMKLSGEGIETDLVVPDETIEAIGETIRSFQAARTSAFLHDTYFRLGPAKR